MTTSNSSPLPQLFKRLIIYEESDFADFSGYVSNDEDIGIKAHMEEYHKLLTNQVDDRLLRYNVSRPPPLGGPPGQVMIQTEFFFNRDLDYLRFGSKGDRLRWFQIRCGSKKSACMTFLQRMVSPTGGSRDINSTSTDTQQKPTEELLSPETILAARDKEVFSPPASPKDQESGYQTTATWLDFMHDYMILDSIRAVVFRDKYGMHMIMCFNKIHKFSDGTLQQIDEALDIRQGIQKLKSPSGVEYQVSGHE
ncbi:hypothetical protein Tco_1391518 [Tanacetum coccineum]